jgi:hypothetical protein
MRAGAVFTLLALVGARSFRRISGSRAKLTDMAPRCGTLLVAN